MSKLTEVLALHAQAEAMLEAGRDKTWRSADAASLKTGDVVLIEYLGTDIRCTILRDAEPGRETVWPLAGRPCVRFWARREDTGAEGYMTYGPNGVARLAISDGEVAA